MEQDIFLAYTADFSLLKKYGFSFDNGQYVYEKDFNNGEFKAIITVDNDGKVKGRVIEKEFNEEFTQIYVEDYQGGFIGEVRKEYGEILLDIREKCFIKEAFVSKQANRLAKKIEEKYGEVADYPFNEKKYKNYGVFRYKSSGKWYAIIMNIGKKFLLKTETKATADVINVKIDEGKREELLKINGIFPSYHMNKQKWISVILDETLSDEKVLNLIDESRTLVAKKKK